MDEFSLDVSDTLKRRMEELTRGVSANEPESLRTYLSRPPSNIPHAFGTTIPILDTLYRQRSDLLFVPASFEENRWREGVAVYLTLEDYQVGMSQVPPAAAVKAFLMSRPKHVHIEILAALNLLTQDQDHLSFAQGEYRAFLNDAAGVRFDRAVHSEAPEGSRIFLARHMILRAMWFVFVADDYEPLRTSNPPWVDTILFVHSLGWLFGQPDRENRKLFGMPTYTFTQIQLSAVFDNLPDPFVSLSIYSRIWRDYGPMVTNPRPRLEPVEMVQEATGLHYLDLLALGFAIFGFGESWEPPKPATLPATIADFMSEVIVERYLSIASASMENLAGQAKLDQSGWGINFIRERPLLRRENDIVVLDSRYALLQTLSGLYGIVKEHERKQHGDAAAQSWHLSYTRMLELFVLDTLRNCAVESWAKDDTTFYTENDLQRAFPGRKVCDAAIHFGSDLCLFEVFGGQLNFGRTDEGRIETFERDVRNAVLDRKADQLNKTIRTMLDHERRVTRFPPTKDMQIIPVIVVAEGLPMNPLTDNYIEQALRANRAYNNLHHERVVPLAVIDMFDVVALEGLASAGVSTADVLREWKRSASRRLPLRMYIERHYQSPEVPARYLAPGTLGKTEVFLDEILSRIQSRQST